jgi:PTH1 family peptidyl-tRNA hydrolase
MKIILAQGNPGIDYSKTRHNIGFTVLDTIIGQYGASFQLKPKFMADIAEYTINGEKVIFAKPTTFYNETGQTARSLVDFYKCDPSVDLLVIHDDLALPFGTIRTREKGSDAGNNGIKSINSHIGKAYSRVRIGIYNDQRDQMDDAAFVLARFSKEEAKKIPVICEKTQEIIDQFITGSFVITSHS